MRADQVATLRMRQTAAQERLTAAIRAQQVWHAAEQRALAELDQIASEWQHLDGGAVELQRRSVVAEAAVALRVSDRTLESRMLDAAALCREWPEWLAAFEAGEIGVGHLRTLRAAGAPLESDGSRAAVHADARAQFAREALEIARATSPGRLGSRARRLADRCLAEPLVERHRAARRERCVWVAPEEDGMSLLGIRLPSTLAKGIEHRLVAIAKTRPDDDPRTLGNVMADTAAELLLTGAGAAGLPGFEHIRATVHVTIPVDGLVTSSAPDGRSVGDPVGARQAEHATSEGSSTLDGGEPLDVDTARVLAARASVWWRLFLDPVTMHPVGIDRHDPTRAQRELLAARDLTCRFPGCAATAWRADVDHTVPFATGGCTDIGNLAHLCRRHHTLKHHHCSTEHAWRVEQLGHGYLAWTSPAGRTYIDEPVAVGPRSTRPVFTDVTELPPKPDPPPF